MTLLECLMRMTTEQKHQIAGILRDELSMVSGALAAYYGAYYYPATDEPRVANSSFDDYYGYTAFVGANTIKEIHPQDSVIMLSDDKNRAIWIADQTEIDSKHFAVLFRGYRCGNKMASVNEKANLPYVNGCATKQIFPPERVGDPTLQLLTIPPYTSEQVHHIHPTARVVYVLAGSGVSVVGQGDKNEITELTEGMTIILDPMCPHHFRTTAEYLTVLPVHIYSSGPSGIDEIHPMRSGTKEV